MGPDTRQTNLDLALIEGLLEQSDFPQCIISRDYRLLAFNKAYQDRYDRGKPLKGKRCHEVSHGSPVPCADNGEDCPLLQCMQTVGPASVLHIHDEKQGRRKVQIDMVPLLSRDRRPVGFLETIRPQIDHKSRGIILFDIKGYLYQDCSKENPDIDLINAKQEKVLAVLHRELRAERAFRLGTQHSVPTVEHFVCNGDGYYLICKPDTIAILDIAHTIRGILDAHAISAYVVAHVGHVHSFVDMTGKTSVTGFAVGEVARLQSISASTADLVCSRRLAEHWQDNPYFGLDDEEHSGVAKDGVHYHWRIGQRL